MIIQELRCPPPQVYPPVSPLCHGGLLMSSTRPAYKGFPSIPPPQVHCVILMGGLGIMPIDMGGCLFLLIGFPLWFTVAPPRSPAGLPSLGYHHVPVSIGPTGGFPGLSLVSLAHEDLCLSSSSDVTMSLLVAGQAVPLHFPTPSARPVPFPPGAPQLLPLVAHHGFPSAPAPPPPVVLQVVVPPLVVWVEPLKLSPLPDAKSFIDHFKLIQYYLCAPEYSTGHRMMFLSRMRLIWRQVECGRGSFGLLSRMGLFVFSLIIRVTPWL